MTIYEKVWYGLCFYGKVCKERDNVSMEKDSRRGRDCVSFIFFSQLNFRIQANPYVFLVAADVIYYYT